MSYNNIGSLGKGKPIRKRKSTTISPNKNNQKGSFPQKSEYTNSLKS